MWHIYIYCFMIANYNSPEMYTPMELFLMNGYSECVKFPIFPNQCVASIQWMYSINLYMRKMSINVKATKKNISNWNWKWAHNSKTFIMPAKPFGWISLSFLLVLNDLIWFHVFENKTKTEMKKEKTKNVSYFV